MAGTLQGLRRLPTGDAPLMWERTLSAMTLTFADFGPLLFRQPQLAQKSQSDTQQGTLSPFGRGPGRGQGWRLSSFWGAARAMPVKD